MYVTVCPYTSNIKPQNTTAAAVTGSVIEVAVAYH